MNRVLIIVPLALLAIGGLWWSQRPRGPVTVSGIIEAHDIRVGSRVGGRVREVRVSEGDRVKTGDVLVTLDPYDLNERLSEAEAMLAAQRTVLTKLTTGFRSEDKAQSRATRDRYRAALDKAIAGPREIEKQIARDRVTLSEADMTKADFEYQRMKALFDRTEASSDEMSDAVWAVDVARARLSEAKDELELLNQGTRAEELAEARAWLAQAEAALALQEAGYRPEEVAEAEASVKAAESRVAAIRRQIEELTIVAPSECMVEAIDLKGGDLIAAGAPVVTLLDTGEMWVRAYVPQSRAGLMLGQELGVRVDAFPERRFRGHVSFVSREAEFTPANAQTPEERSKQVFRIKVTMDEGLGELRAGMAADVLLEVR